MNCIYLCWVEHGEQKAQGTQAPTAPGCVFGGIRSSTATPPPDRVTSQHNTTQQSKQTQNIRLFLRQSRMQLVGATVILQIGSFTVHLCKTQNSERHIGKKKKSIVVNYPRLGIFFCLSACGSGGTTAQQVLGSSRNGNVPQWWEFALGAAL